MRFWSLPPAARVQIWSKCAESRTLKLALRPQAYAALSVSPRVRLPTISAGRYATVNVSESNKILQPPVKDGSKEISLDWDGITDAVREAMDRQSQKSPKEKDAVLANLQWCVKNRTIFSKALADRQFLPRIQTAMSASDPIIKIGGIIDEAMPHLLDITRKEQYANAPPRLFQVDSAHNEIHNICQDLKIGQEIEAKISSDGVNVECALQLKIPGIADEHTFGKGPIKRVAKRKAWAAMLTRLDTTGALSKLLSPSTVKQKDTIPKADGALGFEPLVGEIELVDVEEEIMRQEKDGLVDVFNYAAKFGLVPHFATRMLKRRVRGSGKRKVRKVVQVSIRLPEQKIDVVAHGDTGLEAEVTAVLAFKRAAEQLQMQHDQVPGIDKNFRALSVLTAPYFVRKVARLENRNPLELKREELPSHDIIGIACQLELNGEPIGQRVVGRTKRAAEQLACLTAAVELARKRPEVLSQFAASLTQGSSSRSEMLGSYPAIATGLKAEALDIMKSTLSEAGHAGLSHYQESLTAMSTSMARPRRRPCPQTASAAASRLLLDRLQRFEADSSTAEIRNARAALPMSHYSSKVLDIVSSNVYSIVVGATGSGKTTQVPQIILDDEIRRSEGGKCNVICTQPRRLAATSVARRVATERGENLGQSVGYQVRGDSKLPRVGGSITYCTTGLLVERLKWDADGVMDDATHLIIDEVHERDIFIDFLLIVLKKAITARQLAGKTVPKVILMSATMDTRLFSAYLPNEVDGKSTPCPSLDVPGRTFPVKEKYLDDILGEITKAHPEEFLRLAARDKDDTSDYLIAERAFERVGGEAEPVADGGTVSVADDEANSVASSMDWKKKQDQNDSQAVQKEEGLVPIALLVATIAHICETTADGAILAFLPGLQEITAAEVLMKQEAVFGIDFTDEVAFCIHLLHSTVPADQQRAIFEPIPASCRRIILSTNIAETSVTVPDVKHVIDLGKLRQNTYAHEQRVSALRTVWESNSNARQRAGRAGRVSDGNYYALYSRKRREAMPPSGLPELLRADLQATCLSIKAQGFQESVSSFLSAAIEPPLPEAVQFAVENLKAIEAFTENEEVTALGGVLAKLPVHPALGKMILLGLIFRCLDPMIIIASMYGERALFMNPPDNRMVARATKQHFNLANSDHLAALKGFQDLRQHSHDSDERSVFQRANRLFLHYGGFRAISRTAKQVEETLIDAGLLDADATQVTDTLEIGGEALNRNSNNVDLIKCLLLAGVYPNVGVRGAHVKSRLFRTASSDKVLMHPSSVNAVTLRDQSSHAQIYAFTTLVQSLSGGVLFIRDSSLITPLAAMLFGGRLEADESSQELLMDEWLPFKFDGNARETMALIKEFREAKDRMLNSVFRLLSNPNETAKAVDVMEIFTDGLVRLLDADAEGRESEKILDRQKIPTLNGDVLQETAWSSISQLYRSKALSRMEL
ncbi:uncharacterized protein N0V89_012387 [Didymosphaeria variabile]|uniref:P-loop containing nucleoside triphosphate hydrolase protein n=1 Tax=Didymosphaeria variabile TaxID=1932322 RepID=A0A9W8X9C0_9PLEO|nr:uncharacterized protein N0V89_012387 [Didymosphaeria variabile]KAJ4344643.1 hypothetical protein N0V89_012387 [Didymosphaeria variabile]